jgi:hypothetical protein
VTVAGCIRTAWLDLYGDGSVTVALENGAAGYFCSSLDLGYPTVREVTNPRPAADGVDDRTMYMGPRAVTANITALVGAGARIDAVGPLFAQYMIPSARPQLHYILDRPGAAERMITVRAANYAGPIVGAVQRDLQLQWVAADPYVYDPNWKQATARAGASSGPGRLYPLGFPRTYPAGSGSSSVATISTAGDVGIQPRYLIYGPVTNPVLTVTPSTTGTPGYIRFQPGFVIPAGQWLDIDSAAKTANMNSVATASVLSSVDWMNSSWPVVPPAPASATLALSGSSTTGNTQVQASWRDRYLT